MSTCRCASVDTTDHDGSLAAFARVRDECAALKEILIPDPIWHKYKEVCSADPDEACHAPVAYLAFKRRYLARLTAPIHLFCLENGAPHPALTPQYSKDLAERWMLKENVKQRFQRARIFQGRVVELLFAAWLHQQGWRVDSLEALGGVTDVVATCPAGNLVAFEVKHLGQDEVLFDLGIDALSKDGVSCAWIPVYSPIDYLLFRIFEASRQLHSSHKSRVVAMVLANYDVYFKIPLSEDWVDWKNPSFFRKEADIEYFLRKQYASNPNLNQDMKHYISQIDKVWFCGICNELILKRQQIVEVRSQ